MIDELLLRLAQGGVVAARLAPHAIALAGRAAPLAVTTPAPVPPPVSPAPAPAPIAPAAPTPLSPLQPSPTLAPSSNSTGATTTPSQGDFPTILLTCLIWSSLAVGLLLLLLPERTAEQRSRIRVTALAGAAIPLVLAIGGLNFEHSQDILGGGTSFEENHSWISSLPVQVDYHLAADGISLPLLLLTTLVGCVAVLASWRIERRVRLHLFCLLALETCVTGALSAFDYMLFVLFAEAALVPLVVLVGLDGGEQRARAARRLAAYGAGSGVLLLAGALLVGVKGAQGSFELLQNAGQPAGSGVILTRGIGELAFWLCFAAFAVRLAVVPIHGWLVETCGAAPASVSALLPAAVLNLGGYGMIRICLAGFPQAAHHFSLVLGVLAALTAVWGTLGALGQDDLRRLIAYVSVGQMAIVLLAVSAQSSIALNGAVLEMVAQGLSGAMLLLLAGSIHDRTRTTSIAALGGLAWQTPRLALLWIFAGLCALGLPLLAGFIAEFQVFTGAFEAHRVLTLVVMASTAITTGVLVLSVERVFFGPSREAFQRVRDAGTLELATLLPLATAVVLFGVLPGWVIPIVNNGVQSVTARLVGT